ncbi:endoplasmic reticulum retention protein [Rhizoclosmatium sp. JEL0117]|nr:endoplasmic reticulum retention protein [Rhizoclosmatium sp. JEL0117]
MTMNIFRFLGDMAHLASILILLLKINQSRSAAGISFKSQALYLAVFVARYPDLFYKFFSLYNTVSYEGASVLVERERSAGMVLTCQVSFWLTEPNVKCFSDVIGRRGDEYEQRQQISGG